MIGAAATRQQDAVHAIDVDAIELGELDAAVVDAARERALESFGLLEYFL